jgi:hypothetical protein
MKNIFGSAAALSRDRAGTAKLLCAGVAALLSLALSAVPSPAATNAEIIQFRSDFGRFLDDLSALEPKTRALDNHSIAPAFESLAEARDMLDEASPEDLAQLEEAMSRNPETWNVPATLAGRLTLATRGVSRETIGVPANPALCADDSGQAHMCEACPASTNLGVTDQIIIAGIVLGLNTVWEPVADGLEIPLPIGCARTPHPVKVILGIAVYAAKTIELAIETANIVHSDCEDDYGSRVANYNLDDTVTSRASADAVAALLASILALQAEALKFDIEANMVGESSRTAISQFQLPEQHGGYLEKVRNISFDAIEDLQTPGDHLDDARRYLAQGDTNYGLGKWVEAYEGYRAAYRVAVSDDPTAARRRYR